MLSSRHTREETKRKKGEVFRAPTNPAASAGHSGGSSRIRDVLPDRLPGPGQHSRRALAWGLSYLFTPSSNRLFFEKPLSSTRTLRLAGQMVPRPTRLALLPTFPRPLSLPAAVNTMVKENDVIGIILALYVAVGVLLAICYFCFRPVPVGPGVEDPSPRSSKHSFASYDSSGDSDPRVPPGLGRGSGPKVPPGLGRASDPRHPPGLDRNSGFRVPPDLDRASSPRHPSALGRDSNPIVPPRRDRASGLRVPPKQDRNSGLRVPPDLDRPSGSRTSRGTAKGDGPRVLGGSDRGGAVQTPKRIGKSG